MEADVRSRPNVRLLRELAPFDRHRNLTGTSADSANTPVFVVGGECSMLHNGTSACVQGPHLPVRLLMGRPTAVRKGLCEPGFASRIVDPTIRYELVARVRKEIAAGTYDTPEKMNAALARMLDRCDLA